MPEVMEHFGLALIAMLAIACTLKMIFAFVEPGGILYTVVINYMSSICG